MRNCLTVAVSLLLFFICSCEQKVEFEDSPLMHVVPSDAISVAYYNSCDTCLARMVDSTDKYNSIALGCLSKRPAAFSYNKGRSLIPMLAIDLGAELSEANPEVRTAIQSLRSLGFRYRCVSVEGSNILVVSASEELLSAVIFHLDSGESILSSEGFADAYCESETHYIRNSTVAPLVKLMFPLDPVRDSLFTAYLRKACDWLVLKDTGNGAYDMIPCRSDDARYFVNVFNGLEGGVSLMPQSGETVAFIDLVLNDWRKYRENFEKYLDSENELVSLKKQKAWAESFEPLEIAKYKWTDGEVLLARGRKMPKDTTQIVPNKISGFIPALFGSAFSLQEESHSSYAGGWLILGSEKNIEKYLNIDKPETLPERNVFAKVKIGPEGTLCWNKQGLKFYVY